MQILGDVLETIIKDLDHANKKTANRLVHKINEEETNNDGLNNNNNNNNNNSSSSSNEPMLRRPWIDILTCNKSSWQKKHDAGETGIMASGSHLDLRPSSVNSITSSKSRPSSAVSSTPSNATVIDNSKESNGN